MLTYQNHIIRTSVRRLVEFVLRSGDITTGSGPVSDPEGMREGVRLHKKLQSQRSLSYQKEVPLKMSWELGEEKLVLMGRADGVDMVEYEGEEIPLIEEIKCIYGDVSALREPDPLHLAQAKCYAAMIEAQEEGEEKAAAQEESKDAALKSSTFALRITYCNMDTEEVRSFPFYIEREELAAWFEKLLEEYRTWARYAVRVQEQRRESLCALTFPFPPRPGQNQLMAVVWQGIEKRRHLFLQAPTGVGKTISTLYPALKLLGEEKAEKIFYLTAKTITRTVAEQTLSLLTEQGLRLKTVSITAKERICPNGETDCNPSSCRRAKGHYDRINEALYALLTERDLMTRETILEYGARYEVCPYELSFEAAVWADAVICDYNYVFDPHVNRKSLFGDQNEGVLLIDEAHNLLERAREMYSARLKKEDVLRMKRMFKERDKGLVKRLQSVNEVLLSLAKETQQESVAADSLYYPLFWLLAAMEEYLKDHPEEEQREEMLEFYFSARHFFMILDTMEDGYHVYGTGAGGHYCVHLFCVDPSSRLKEYLDRCRSGIFFSATLLPIRYYKQLLGGGETDAYCISSSFDREKRLLAIAEDVTSRYRQRGPAQYQKIVGYLEKVTAKKTGNYMIFFPSYEMANEVIKIAEGTSLVEKEEILVQEPSMGEAEKEAFLQKFAEHRDRSLIGFCVLGSIFSEGIDLTGEKLIGVLIVGTGLPQICKEREMIRDYFDRQGKKGYDYAYRYPGMNKVLQAAGRLIRTSSDVGVILLLDDRFLLPENLCLLPEEWDRYYRVNLENVESTLEVFWKKVDDAL